MRASIINKELLGCLKIGFVISKFSFALEKVEYLSLYGKISILNNCGKTSCQQTR